MRSFAILLVAGSLLLPRSPLHAADKSRENTQDRRVTVPTIVTDFFIVRPVALVGFLTAIPVATVAVPVAAIMGNAREVSREVLGKPFHHTFRRHLGYFPSD
jgi:hypothetical protein